MRQFGVLLCRTTAIWQGDLAALGAMFGQALLVVLLMPGNQVGMMGTLVSLSIAGTLLGLAISATAKNEEVAVALVPIVVIPQIILAGVVANLAGVASQL